LSREYEKQKKISPQISQISAEKKDVKTNQISPTKKIISAKVCGKKTRLLREV